MPSIPALLETTINVLHSLNDNKKPPLHVGEVMACWTYLAFVEEIIVYEEIGLNTTTDDELKDILQESLQVARSHQEKISQFMIDEGVPLPNQPQSMPKANGIEIPSGVKFTDSALSNTISINFVIAGDMCAASASQSLRTDVGMMFLQFQMDKLTLGFKMKNLMQNRGWLKIPPFYTPPGLPKS